MRVGDRKKKSLRETPKDKTSQKPQFRPPHKKYSPYDHFENWVDIQLEEEEWSLFTGDGPYYEVDDEDRIE